MGYCKRFIRSFGLEQGNWWRDWLQVEARDYCEFSILICHCHVCPKQNGKLLKLPLLLLPPQVSPMSQLVLLEPATVLLRVLHFRWIGSGHLVPQTCVRIQNTLVLTQTHFQNPVNCASLAEPRHECPTTQQSAHTKAVWVTGSASYHGCPSRYHFGGLLSFKKAL